MFKNRCSNSQYLKGRDNEQKLKPILEKYFETKLEDMGRYSKMDFVDILKKLYIEIKGRNISKDKYLTTLLNYEKIEYANKLLAEDKERKIYFVFSFTDGVYFIKYDEYLFSTFNKKNFYLQARNCMVFNYEVPLDKLIKI